MSDTKETEQDALTGKRKAEDHEETPANKKQKTEEFCFLQVHVKLEGSNAERVLSIATHESFACLAEGIIQAFNYDIQRVYSFHLDNQPYSQNGPTYYSPVANKTDGKTSSDCLLAEVEWVVGQKFLLLYDYSENHNFTVTVQEISMENETKEISILQQFSVGEAPPQAEDTSDESYDVEESSGGDEIELQASSEEDE